MIFNFIIGFLLLGMVVAYDWWVLKEFPGLEMYEKIIGIVIVIFVTGIVGFVGVEFIYVMIREIMR